MTQITAAVGELRAALLPRSILDTGKLSRKEVEALSQPIRHLGIWAPRMCVRAYRNPLHDVKIRKKKKEGLIDPNIDERYLLFLITCIIIMPYSFPGLTKSIVGVSPYSKSFKTNFSLILTQFSKGLKDVS